MPDEKTDMPTVLLIGRTNAGKSSLFNRLTETEKALVTKVAGTTRDYNHGIVEWGKHEFKLIDTGGIDLSTPDDIEQKMLSRVWTMINDADKVLLVVDAKAGLLPNDKNIAQQLHKAGIDFWLVANKSDSPRLRENANEFYSISEHVYPASAANGSGTGDLLDELLQELNDNKKNTIAPEQNIDSEEDKPISVAIVGIPNAGKSSLINSLLGREEVIVSPQEHTTRESRDTDLQYNGIDIKLIDTAGLRKARKMRQMLMRKSAERSMEAIKEADWVIFTIDSTQPKWGEQDRYILNEIIKSGTSVVVAANKWDMLEGEDRFKEFEDKWSRSFGTYKWIPVVPISAKNGWHVNKLLDQILKYHENRSRLITEKGLDKLLKQAIKRRRPQKKKGPEAPYVHKIKQLDTNPPTFELVIHYKDTLAESYVRFLKKMFREKFEFTATPVRIFVRSIK